MANEGQSYDNEKRGAIFPSEYKKAAIAKGQPNADKLPDGSGSLVVNGVKYYVSSWTKTGQKGKFISFSIESEEDAQARSSAKKGGNSGGYAAPKAGSGNQQATASKKAPIMPDFEDDDLPF